MSPSLVEVLARCVFDFGIFMLCGVAWSLVYLFCFDIIYFISRILGCVRWRKSEGEKGTTLRPLKERCPEVFAIAIASSVASLGIIWNTVAVVMLRRTWWWYAPYACWCQFSKTRNRGGRPSQRFRKSFFWRWAGSYFPTTIHMLGDVEYPAAAGPYLFGYHPHGIFACGAVASLICEGAGDRSKLFPGLDIRGGTIDAILRTPGLRDWALAQGFVSVSEESLDHFLQQYVLSFTSTVCLIIQPQSRCFSGRRGNGKAVVIVVGGAHEALYTRAGCHDLVLKKRKGFFRCALRHGCTLVPCFCFGEDQLYETYEMSPALLRLSEVVKRIFGYSVPAFQGRGICQRRFGFIPRRCPLRVVIGRPIRCQVDRKPDESVVDELQDRYCDGLIELFEKSKWQFAVSPEKEKLNFVL